MKVAVVGLGFVGAPLAAVTARSGHQVVGYDVDEDRIAAFNSLDKRRIESYVNEPLLFDEISRSHGRHLLFSSDINEAVIGAQAVFLCVGTPTVNGKTDLSIYRKAAEDVVAALREGNGPLHRRVAITKSTVPIGTSRMLEQILKDAEALEVGVVSNPEFLPEGEAMERSIHPDKIIVGANNPADFEIMRKLYSAFRESTKTAYVETTPETAEAIKYVSNAMLFFDISKWNGIAAPIGEMFPGADFDALKRGVLGDRRISSWGSYIGSGAGGSCLGKDLLSLAHQFREAGIPTDLLDAVYRVNEHQKTYLVDRIKETGFKLEGSSIAVLGLSFKQGTADVRDSSALVLVDRLLNEGVRRINAYDPIAIEEAGRYFRNYKDPRFERIKYFHSAIEAIRNTGALFISTDHQEFRGLDTTIFEETKPPYVVVDGRRMLTMSKEEFFCKGYTYLAVGSKTQLSKL